MPATPRSLLTTGKNFILFWSIGLLTCFVTGCDLSSDGEADFQEVNTVYVDNRILDFKAAMLTITGPVNISQQGSHVLAKLILSTDEDFTGAYSALSSVLSIDMYAFNTGFNLPKFPLQSGNYLVLPDINITYYDTSILAGKNFTLGSEILLSYDSQQNVFNNSYKSLEGSMQIQFDLNDERVRITHNWVTDEGISVTGSNSLYINLSQFTP